jgi:hypothetical protein
MPANAVNPMGSAEYEPSQPATAAFAITPNDGADLAKYTRALYIGVSGDVKVDMIDGGTGIVFKAVAVGILPIAVKRVYATGTAATNIIGLQ